MFSNLGLLSAPPIVIRFLSIGLDNESYMNIGLTDLAYQYLNLLVGSSLFKNSFINFSLQVLAVTTVTRVLTAFNRGLVLVR